MPHDNNKAKQPNDLASLYQEVRRTIDPYQHVDPSFGGKSREDLLQETFLVILEQGPNCLPVDPDLRKEHLLKIAERLQHNYGRRERRRQKAHGKAAELAPVESVFERLHINDENHRILVEAWLKLKNKPLHRELLFLLASGVDVKDNKFLGAELGCTAGVARNAKRLVIRLLQSIKKRIDELEDALNKIETPYEKRTIVPKKKKRNRE